MKQSEFEKVLAKNEAIIANSTDQAIIEQAQNHIDQCLNELEPDPEAVEISRKEYAEGNYKSASEWVEYLQDKSESKKD